MWWHMPLMSALGGLPQSTLQFQGSIGKRCLGREGWGVDEMIAESRRCLDILSYDSRSETEENGDCCVSEQTQFIKTHIPHASAAPELIVFCVILRHTQSIPFLK